MRKESRAGRRAQTKHRARDAGGRGHSASGRGTRGRARAAALLASVDCRAHRPGRSRVWRVAARRGSGEGEERRVDLPLSGTEHLEMRPRVVRAADGPRWGSADAARTSFTSPTSDPRAQITFYRIVHVNWYNFDVQSFTLILCYLKKFDENLIQYRAAPFRVVATRPPRISPQNYPHPPRISYGLPATHKYPQVQVPTFCTHCIIRCC